MTIAKVLGWGNAATEPEKFLIVSSLAIARTWKHPNIDIAQVDIYEVNDAFSVVPLVNTKILDLALRRLSIHGGAVFWAIL
jgi:acetyl-CoA C-acetyltransferase